LILKDHPSHARGGTFVKRQWLLHGSLFQCLGQLECCDFSVPQGLVKQLGPLEKNIYLM
jgi:hypothetical protein